VARVDYEAAWTDLQEHAASKTSHGREDLLVTMATIAAEHRIPEDLLEKAARVAGGVPITRAEASPSSTADHQIDERMDGGPPPTDDPGGHDGRFSRGRAGEPVRT
jgi:hypothetical protein